MIIYIMANGRYWNQKQLILLKIMWLEPFHEYDTSNRISSVTYTSADGFSNTSHLTYENNTVL